MTDTVGRNCNLKHTKHYNKTFDQNLPLNPKTPPKTNRKKKGERKK